MTIYYFSGDIIREGIILGKFKKEFFQSKEELISTVERILKGGFLDGKTLTEKELNSIVEETMPDFDFYSVQFIGTYGQNITQACFKTYEEAVEYCKGWRNRKIIGQHYGRRYREIEERDF